MVCVKFFSVVTSIFISTKLNRFVANVLSHSFDAHPDDNHHHDHANHHDNDHDESAVGYELRVSKTVVNT